MLGDKYSLAGSLCWLVLSKYRFLCFIFVAFYLDYNFWIFSFFITVWIIFIGSVSHKKTIVQSCFIVWFVYREFCIAKSNWLLWFIDVSIGWSFLSWIIWIFNISWTESPSEISFYCIVKRYIIRFFYSFFKFCVEKSCRSKRLFTCKQIYTTWDNCDRNTLSLIWWYWRARNCGWAESC